MKKLKSRILLTILVTSLLTVYSKAQTLGNKICFNNSEVDYFINEVLTSKSLKVDTFLLNVKIKRQDSLSQLMKSNIIDLKSNEKDLKLSLKKEKLVSASYQKSYFDKCEKYDKKVKWNDIYKKVIIGGITLQIIEVGLLYLILK